MSGLILEVEQPAVVAAEMLGNILQAAAAQSSVETAFEYLANTLPARWRVGRGGHHVWLKQQSRLDQRVAIIKEPS